MLSPRAIGTRSPFGASPSEPGPKAAQYNVDGWTPERFFTAVRADLERYAREFLTGDLAQFLAVRAKQNSAREPYMVYAPDPSGAYAKSPEPGSENLKERYSKPE